MGEFTPLIKDKAFVKGQRYMLLSRWENLSLPGRRPLEKLLSANKRPQAADLLRESFDQPWGYSREGWARRFFDNWKESLKRQRLKPFEKFDAIVEPLNYAMSLYYDPLPYNPAISGCAGR